MRRRHGRRLWSYGGRAARGRARVHGRAGVAFHGYGVVEREGFFELLLELLLFLTFGGPVGLARLAFLRRSAGEPVPRLLARGWWFEAAGSTAAVSSTLCQSSNVSKASATISLTNESVNEEIWQVWGTAAALLVSYKPLASIELNSHSIDLRSTLIDYMPPKRGC